VLLLSRRSPVLRNDKIPDKIGYYVEDYEDLVAIIGDFTSAFEKLEEIYSRKVTISYFG
jgi:hypothetical protein